MKRRIWIPIILLMILSLSGCSSDQGTFSSLPAVDLSTVSVLEELEIRAGDSLITAILYDTETARAFIQMLPLTVETWHAAPNFARAFDLPSQIPEYERAGYEYEPGSLAYWYSGPSIAMIYKASRDRTVVPVVPIGRMTSDPSMLEDYEGEITV